MPKPSKDVPNAGEFARLVAHLKGRGAKAAELAAGLGGNPNGRTRRQIADALAAWLRGRPKGA